MRSSLRHRLRSARLRPRLAPECPPTESKRVSADPLAAQRALARDRLYVPGRPRVTEEDATDEDRQARVDYLASMSPPVVGNLRLTKRQLTVIRDAMRRTAANGPGWVMERKEWASAFAAIEGAVNAARTEAGSGP
jgi:hypothetical protein